MSKTFRPWQIDEPLLFPPCAQDFVGEGHLAGFVVGLVVEHLDLREIEGAYGSERGQPPFHPAMMTALLLYAYCNGVHSSRRIAKASRERVDFMSVVGLDAPDFRTVSDFRKRHLKPLAGLFTQVLKLCEQAGLAKLGHVALDGTKIKANASKHKAMSYERMEKAEKELAAEVQALLAEAARVDAEEDGKYGKGKRGDELPKELARRESRLEKIREAKAALEQEAREAAEKKQAEVAAQLKEREKQEGERGRKFGGRPPQAPDAEEAKPEPQAQRNFTDPESRIMKDGATKEFVQAYNAQAAVDSQAQVIVGAAVTQEANDKKQLVPMLKEVKAQMGRPPRQVTADNGYFSEANVTDAQLQEIDLFVAPDGQKHGEKPPATTGPPPSDASVAEQMRHKLRTAEGQAVYKLRKAVVEPVFGQIKEARGFRRFLLRGLEKVQAEWQMICATHNLLKLFRSGWSPQRA